MRDPGVRPSIAALLDHPWIVRLARRNQTADNRVRRVQARSTVDGTLMRSLTVSGVRGRQADGIVNACMHACGHVQSCTRVETGRQQCQGPFWRHSCLC